MSKTFYVDSCHEICSVCGNMNKDCMCEGDNMSEE